MKGKKRGDQIVIVDDKKVQRRTLPSASARSVSAGFAFKHLISSLVLVLKHVLKSIKHFLLKSATQHGWHLPLKTR